MIKDEIITVLAIYFDSLEKAEDWYSKTNIYFTNGKDALSPKQMVDQGNGEEVLKWIKISIG